MKRLIIVLLALALICCAFACTSGEKGNNNGEESSEETTVGIYELPEKNFEGRDLRIHAYENFMGMEFFIAEDSTNPVQSSLWTRNSTLQDTYNVEITPVYATNDGTLYGQVNETLQDYFAEEDNVDITAPTVVAAGTLILNHVLYDWSKMEYTHLEQSYWMQGINDAFTLDNKLYIAAGDTNLTTVKYTYSMLFNLTKANELKLTDKVYDAIDNKEWTIDFFIDLVAPLHDDIDEVPGESQDDFYGFQGEALTNLDVWPFVFGIPMLEQDETDLLKLSFGQGDYAEKLSVAADKMTQLYWETSGSLCHSAAGAEIRNFKAGRALFATINFGQIINTVKDMEEQYTVLPYPMFDTEQGEYLSGLQDGYTLLAIPVTTADPSFSSFMAEALNIGAEKTIYPVYYEETLQTKYQTDARASEMIELIMNGRHADLGVVFQASLGRISMIFRDVIRANNNDISKYLDEREENIISALQTIIDTYRNPQV